MRLAFPVWETKISPVLDTAARLLIVEVRGRGELSRSEVRLDEKEISKRCRTIRGFGVDVLVCGAVTRQMSDMLKDSGIQIVPGVSGHPEEVLHAYLQGTLAHPRFLMPGWSLDKMEEHLKGMERTAAEGQKGGRTERR